MIAAASIVAGSFFSTALPDRQGDLPRSRSFCRVEPDNVALTAFKPADDSKGIIVRLRETAGRDTNVMITTDLAASGQAYRCDLVERRQHPVNVDGNRVTLPVKANAMAAVRLE